MSMLGILLPPCSGVLPVHCLELCGLARNLADGAGMKVTALLLKGTEAAARQLIAAGADTVFCLEVPEALLIDDMALARALLPAVKRLAPEILLSSATIRMRSLAPCLATLLHTGLTADCTGLSIGTDGLLLQARPAFGGNVTARIVCRSARPQMATVRPGVFLPPKSDPSRTGEVITESPAPVEPSVSLAGVIFAEASSALCGAPIVLAGGKGIGSRQGFEVLLKAAKVMGACVGATRSAVDAGYAPYSMQIGQTGIAVHPRLYIALGISGAVQHIAGMASSKRVIAVNTDKNAPIFAHADLGILGDWQTVLNEIIKAYQERRLHREL